MEIDEYGQMGRLEDRHWYFAGKRRLVLSLLERYRTEKDLLVLDGGCGTGRTLAELALAHDAIGLEPFAGALAYAKRCSSAPLVQGSLAQLPFRDGIFDAVTLLDVLEHCDDDRQALQETGRVLTAGGLLIITVPAYQWLWSAHDEALHHRRRYNRVNLLRLVEQCGFVVDKSSYFNTFVFPLVAIMRLVGKMMPGNTHSSDTDAMPRPFLNSLLYGLQRLERAIIGCWGFPFGVSLACVARKR